MSPFYAFGTAGVSPFYAFGAGVLLWALGAAVRAIR